MKHFIKKYLCNDKIYAILKLMKNINNDNFIKKINKNIDEEIIIYSRNGMDNLDKNIFVINLNEKNMGLGAYLKFTLVGLYEAEKMHFNPVVIYGKDCMYKENKVFLETYNVFEYYFNQPTKIKSKEIETSNRVYSVNFSFLKKCEIDFDINNKMYYTYKIRESYMKELGKIAKKYLTLNENTQDFIKKSFSKINLESLFKYKVLAVHVRGTDYALNWKYHPNMVTVEDFFVEIDKALKLYNFEYIFLATDDSSRLEAFKCKYKEKLIYFPDVHRSSGTINVALEQNDRENNAYLNGLEVIRDIYTLAQCQGLIAGLSQVSIMARIINYSLDDKAYVYKKIIDKGIYKG